VVQSRCLGGKKKNKEAWFCYVFFSVAKGEAKMRQLERACVCYLKIFLVLPYFKEKKKKGEKNYIKKNH